VRGTRRAFLKGAAGVLGAAAWSRRGLADAPASSRPASGGDATGPKITRVETFAVNYPTVGRFKFFEDTQGRPTGRPTVVVKLTAEDGTSGWGQSVPTPKWSYETLETVRATIDRYLAPLLIGRDPCDFDGIHTLMNRLIAPSFSTGQPICKAGIDLALHDLAGRIRKRSAAAEWGTAGVAPAPRITISWTLNPRTLLEIEPLIEEGRRKGYRNFNVKVSPDPKFDVEMCRIVKRLVPDGFLWADANGGYDEATALEVAPKLADAGAAVLEQPVRPNRLAALGKLKRQGALPIILDEGVVSSADLEEFIELGILDGVAMKPARCAGLTDARRQVELLGRHKLMFLGSGLTDPDLSLAASLLLYGAYHLQYPAALNGPQFLAGTSILKTPLIPVDGQLAIPTGPGLGVEVDEAALDRLRA
jgi:L-alanine-DL-glutamate epimerase-like enolase superfamily enzyme